jgi:hypothetical protein
MSPLQNSTDNKSKDEKKQKIIEVTNDFRGYFEINKIFIEKETSDNIEILIRSDDLWNDWMCFVDSPDTPQAEKIREWRKIWERLNTEVNQIKTELEVSFREMLGIRS